MVMKVKELEVIDFSELGGIRPEDNMNTKIRRVEKLLEDDKSLDFNWAMFEVFKREYLFCFIVTSMQIIVYILRPMLMTMLIRYYEDQETAVDKTQGFTLVCLYSFVQWLEYLAREHNFYESGKL